MRSYCYVGPASILASIGEVEKGTKILSGQSVLDWSVDTQQYIESDHCLIVTFTISQAEELLIADRRSEHVHCAGGEDVLSAGEMTFLIDGGVEVIEITNQSTGYCPEPQSWESVSKALENAGIDHPSQFTTEFIFRRCEACGLLNVVKDDYFVCVQCGVELESKWNIG